MGKINGNLTSGRIAIKTERNSQSKDGLIPSCFLPPSKFLQPGLFSIIKPPNSSSSFSTSPRQPLRWTENGIYTDIIFRNPELWGQSSKHHAGLRTRLGIVGVIAAPACRKIACSGSLLYQLIVLSLRVESWSCKCLLDKYVRLETFWRGRGEKNRGSPAMPKFAN